jgi:SAM-dependent methyltransferase
VTYTHGHHSSVLHSHRWRTAANSAGHLLDRLRPGMAVLDVGCGVGTITADLAELVAPGRVAGIDTAPDVVARARDEVTARGLATVELAVGDVYALDFPDGTFDVVHAHQVLQHLADPVRALREMRRVCRPGGLVAARDADYAAMTWYPEVPELAEWLELYRTIAWSGTWADRVTSSTLADQAVGYGLATRADLDRIAAGWRAWGAEPDGWFGVLHADILATA